MKFYIATSLKRIDAHRIVKEGLLEAGHQLTYDWTVHGSVKTVSLERLSQVGENELKGIREADALIVLLPGGKGTHVELGIGIALCKPIILHAETNDHFSLGEEICAFYCLNQIQRIHSSLEEFAKNIPDSLAVC